MLISVVVGNCPLCGTENTYGNVTVRPNSLLRGCKHCKYIENIALPSLNKKIIYLDQFFISGAFRGKEDRLVQAAKEVSLLCEKQLLVAPFSSVHEDETYQWRGYDQKGKEDLMSFMKSSSRGHEFSPVYEVEATQLLKQFKSFLNGGDSKYELEQSDIFHDSVHEWDDYLWIDVGRYTGDIEQIRALKTLAINTLVGCFDGWRQTTSDFQTDVSLEIKQASKNYISSHFEYADRLARGDYSALLDAPIISTYIERLLSCLPKNQPVEVSLGQVIDYFSSPHFANVPYIQVSARIFAAFKAMVRGGSYRDSDRAIKELSGIFYDIKHVSTYAPYCDAFVMDNAMASIVSNGRVGLGGLFGTKVFSLNSWDSLLKWMNDISNSMSTEHKHALELVYPGRY